ncbi:hypothetical protein LTS18_009835, partial [Coniosporium uncinatum]
MATIKKEDDDGIDLHGITSEVEGAFFWPTKFEDLKNEVSKFNQSVISICAVKLKKGNSIPEETRLKAVLGLAALRNVTMTPKLKKATNMENWTEDDWGAEEEAHPQPQDVDMEDTGSDQAEEKLPNQKIQRIEKSGIVKRPSSSHPIYGLGGIMEGILVDKRGPTRTYIFDPPYRRTSPKAYGHNNLAVGKWFPLQIKALADGAHGDRMAGISVGPEGPYSIVASSSG